MTTTAPETAARERLIKVLNEEFKTDKIEFKDDKIHDSLGRDGELGGCYPAESGEFFSDGQVLETTIIVQLFGKWTAEVNPDQEISPKTVEERAERIRRACKEDELGSPGTDHLWYYRVVHIEFPDDPTGNKTRLVATITALSQNAAITETTG